jgi:hypothetical protein
LDSLLFGSPRPLSSIRKKSTSIYQSHFLSSMSFSSISAHPRPSSPASVIMNDSVWILTPDEESWFYNTATNAVAATIEDYPQPPSSNTPPPQDSIEYCHPAQESARQAALILDIWNVAKKVALQAATAGASRLIDQYTAQSPLTYKNASVQVGPTTCPPLSDTADPDQPLLATSYVVITRPLTPAPRHYRPLPPVPVHHSSPPLSQPTYSSRQERDQARQSRKERRRAQANKRSPGTYIWCPCCHLHQEISQRRIWDY